MTVPADVARAVAEIGADRAAGATALVLRGLEILRSAGGSRELSLHVALALCAEQPSMAGFRTAAALIAASSDPLREIDALATRVRRASAAIGRHATPLLRLRRPAASAIRIVTHSRSAAVERTLLDLRQVEPLRVCCSESRPGGEGSDLARTLAETGLDVELYADAGLGSAIPGADAFVVGADAVSSDGFINKVGTAALCALARSQGVPILVLAGREKIVPRSVFRTLPLRDGPQTDPPVGLNYALKTPYFERVSTDVADQLVTDAGALPLSSADEAGSWTARVLDAYLSQIDAYNMLDKR
jgi:translation initiation factor 2B subunit (eIF-2B alpha/beta/delta family)